MFITFWCQAHRGADGQGRGASGELAKAGLRAVCGFRDSDEASTSWTTREGFLGGRVSGAILGDLQDLARQVRD